MKIKKYLGAILVLVLLVACKDNTILCPYDFTDSVRPGQITVTNVKSVAGGAVITYDVPSDEDLMYIKATYTNTQGEIKETRASFYVDSIKISGLGDVNERVVELRAVDRQENESDPVYQSITPGEPSVFKIFDSFDYQADWGGFLLHYDNVDKEEVGIYVTYTNSMTLETVTHDVFFTSRPTGTIAVRGLESVETDFGVFVEDKYGNVSDTLHFTITPWKESELDKEYFRRITVLDDVPWDSYAGRNENAWDGIYPQNWNFAHTSQPVPFPHAMTIDLGVTVKLSRMKIWQYLGSDSDYYGHGFPKHFRIYGCPEEKDPYKEESWTLLLDQEVVKPSGGAFGSPNTADDIEEANRGHEYMFDLDIPSIRYYRFQSLASWSGMEVSRIAEITLWGEVQD